MSFVITNIKKQQKKTQTQQQEESISTHKFIQCTNYTSKIKLSQQINQLKEIKRERERKEFPYNISNNNTFSKIFRL